MNNIKELAEAGIVFDGALEIGSTKAKIGMDAQSVAVTAPNSGPLAQLTSYISPNAIKILMAPLKAVDVVGQSTLIGDWTMDTVYYPVIEMTGRVASYDDHATSGKSGANVNFESRQAYSYETTTNWGAKEVARMELAKIDWVGKLQESSIATLMRFENKSYFYGIDGLKNYGLLNDPSLSAPISPTTKAAGGTTWANGTALENFADIQKLHKQLVLQANSLVDLDTRMVLAMSPTSQTYLTKTTEFNVNVLDLIKKNFPNIRIETAPEYATASGELVQLFAEELEGQRTADCAFTEKLRAFAIIQHASSWEQKKSQTTLGTVIYRPFAVAQMIGV